MSAWMVVHCSPRFSGETFRIFAIRWGQRKRKWAVLSFEDRGSSSFRTKFTSDNQMMISHKADISVLLASHIQKQPLSILLLVIRSIRLNFACCRLAETQLFEWLTATNRCSEEAVKSRKPLTIVIVVDARRCFPNHPGPGWVGLLVCYFGRLHNTTI